MEMLLRLSVVSSGLCCVEFDCMRGVTEAAVGDGSSPKMRTEKENRRVNPY